VQNLNLSWDKQRLGKCGDKKRGIQLDGGMGGYDKKGVRNIKKNSFTGRGVFGWKTIKNGSGRQYFTDQIGIWMKQIYWKPQIKMYNSDIFFKVIITKD
jgi:hypothetical protein